MPATIVTVLKSGGEYTPRHVLNLRDQVRKQLPGALFVALTDQTIPDGVKTVRLEKRQWPGWFAKMELFDPRLKGDILFFDLDTALTGPLDDLANLGKFTLLRDFYRDGVRKPEGIQSCVMYLTEECRAPVWEQWMKNPFQHISKLRMKGLGDQTFLESAIGVAGRPWSFDADRFQDVLPGQIVSYKVHCNPNWKHGATGKVPENARVVCGHGRPRPWHAEWRLE